MERKRPRNIIGGTCRRLRARQGLTQSDLVARCQLMGWMINRTTIAKIESGLRHATDAEVALLAHALGATTDSLLQGTREELLAAARHSPESAVD